MIPSVHHLSVPTTDLLIVSSPRLTAPGGNVPLVFAAAALVSGPPPYPSSLPRTYISSPGYVKNARATPVVHVPERTEVRSGTRRPACDDQVAADGRRESTASTDFVATTERRRTRFTSGRSGEPFRVAPGIIPMECRRSRTIGPLGLPGRVKLLLRLFICFACIIWTPEVSTDAAKSTSKGGIPPIHWPHAVAFQSKRGGNGN